MDFSTLFEPATFLKLSCLAFLSILFLQSGLDKVLNYSGNVEWLKSHFAKSPLKASVRLMMPAITILEVAAGAVSAIGLIVLLINGDPDIGLRGAQISALSILALFFGQRMAQDYVGASVLVGYFLLSLVSIYLLGS